MRYSRGFKRSAIRKTLGGRSINEVARELGIYPGTLNGWIRQYKTGTLTMDDADTLSPNERQPTEKLALVLESKIIPEKEKGEWLRKQGLHTEHLSLWEQELTDTLNEKNTEMKAENNALRKENKQLQKELKRKEKALAEAAVLLTLKKKYQNLFEVDEED